MTRLEEKLERVAKKTLKLLKKENVSLDVYLVSEEGIKLLNKKFRGKDRPTTVLSFKEPPNFPVLSEGPKHLGEIYLCPALIRKKKETMEFLLIHGLLHLLGYNHSKRNDRITMEKLEQKLWRIISSSV